MKFRQREEEMMIIHDIHVFQLLKCKEMSLQPQYLECHTLLR